ncbi:MAG: carboxypeptidase regulatory-like domain-containing protein [Planctomycetota bacterium]
MKSPDGLSRAAKATRVLVAAGALTLLILGLLATRRAEPGARDLVRSRERPTTPVSSFDPATAPAAGGGVERDPLGSFPDAAAFDDRGASWLEARFREPVDAVEFRSSSGGPTRTVEELSDGTTRVWVLDDIDAGGGGGLLDARGYLPVPVQWPPGLGKHDLGWIPLERGFELRVRVTDREGRAVSKAQVSVGRALLSDIDERTDADGVASFAGLARGAIDIRASADEFASATQNITIAGNCEAFFALERAARLKARVVLPDGTPAGDRAVATVDLVSGLDYLDLGPEGEFETEVPMNLSFRLFIDPVDETNGFLPVDRLIPAIAPGETLDIGVIRVEPGATIQGSVRTAERLPAADVEVLVRRDGGLGGSTRTDSSGTYRITGLREGHYTLEATATGHRGSEGGIQLRANETISLDLALSSVAVYRGRVLGAIGEPAVGATVTLQTADGGNDSTSTDEEGGFVVEAGKGSAVCTVSLGMLEHRLNAPSAATLPSVIELPAGGRLVVRVNLVGSDASGLLEWTEVALVQRGDGTEERSVRETCNTEGYCEFLDLPFGQFELTASLDEFKGRRLLPTQPTVVSVSAVGTTTVALECEVEPKRPHVEVRVTDEFGAPVAGARVLPYKQDLEAGLFADTQVLGEARTSPAGSARVQIPTDGGILVVREGYAPSWALAGESEVTEVRLRPEARLRIHVRDPMDRPELDLAVSLRLVASGDAAVVDEGADHPFTLLDEYRRPFLVGERTWEFEELPVGTFEVSVSIGDDTLATQQVSVVEGGHDHLEIDLPGEVEVSVRLVSNGQAPRRGTVELLARTSEPRSIDSSDVLTFRLPCPGSYTFRYTDGDSPFKSWNTWFVRGRQSIEIPVTQYSVRLECVDERGTPISGCRVMVLGNDSYPSVRRGASDPSGAFTATGLPPGDYGVKSFDERGGFACMTTFRVPASGGRVRLDHRQQRAVEVDLSGVDAPATVFLWVGRRPIGLPLSVDRDQPVVRLPGDATDLLLAATSAPQAIAHASVPREEGVPLRPHWRPFVSVSVLCSLFDLGATSVGAVTVDLVPLDSDGLVLDARAFVDQATVEVTPGDYILRLTEGSRVLLVRSITVSPGTEEIDLR